MMWRWIWNSLNERDRILSSPELKVQVSFSDRLSFVVCLSARPSLNFSYFRHLLKNHWAKFNQTWHKASLVEGDSSLLKWRAPPFCKARKLRNSEETLTKLKKLLQNHWAGPISTKLCTMHPWVMRAQVCSNEGLCLSPMGDDYEIRWRNFKKIFFSRTTDPISTKLVRKHPRVKGIQVLKNLLLQNDWSNFNQTWHNASFGKEDSSFFK